MWQVQVRNKLGTEWRPFMQGWPQEPLEFRTKLRAAVAAADLKGRATQGFEYRTVEVD